LAQGGWDKHDQTGPSPLIIHKDQLKAVAQPWLDFSLALKTDSEANAVLGWVLEMWGYVLAAGSLGIKHTVLPNFQIEPGAYPPTPPPPPHPCPIIFRRECLSLPQAACRLVAQLLSLMPEGGGG